MNPTNKKVHQKIELTFNLQKKSLYKLFGPECVDENPYTFTFTHACTEKIS